MLDTLTYGMAQYTTQCLHVVLARWRSAVQTQYGTVTHLKRFFKNGAVLRI